MSTTRLTKHATAGAFVLAATLGLGTASVMPAQSAVVAVAPAPTTTTVTVLDATLAFGETTKVTVSVDTVTPGSKPTGKVELKVGDKVLVADVAASGKVDFDLPVVNASVTPYAVTATFIPSDATAFSGSTSAPVAVTVVKDETTSTVTARHKMGMDKIVAKNLVTSLHGQVPTGTAKFVLKRNGVKLAATIVDLNAVGKARAKFLDVPDKGVYKVISKYLGSDNFLKSRGTFKILA